jgi:5-methylcytosine-specific restriction enzyme A
MATRTRNQIFTFLGAKPANSRWSWCALSPNHQGAVFTLWTDRIVDGQPYRFNTGENDIRARPGATDMKKVLEIVLRKKVPAYGLVCVSRSECIAS